MSHRQGVFRRITHALRDLVRHINLIRSFDLSPKDVVLDVGSGQNPNMRANVLCDRFLADNSERACGGRPVIDRPLVVADAEQLPFVDKAFDFVVCSHLLEHVRHPERLLQELQRVGRRGYIETPSAEHEELYDNSYHKWLVSLDDGALLITPKSSLSSRSAPASWFRRTYDRNQSFREFINRNLEDLGFLVRYYWSDHIRFSVTGDIHETSGFVFAHDENGTRLSLGPRTLGQRARSYLGKWMRRRNTKSEKRLLQRMLCPRCKSVLSGHEGSLSCQLGHRFLVEGNVYYLNANLTPNHDPGQADVRLIPASGS